MVNLQFELLQLEAASKKHKNRLFQRFGINSHNPIISPAQSEILVPRIPPGICDEAVLAIVGVGGSHKEASVIGLGWEAVHQLCHPCLKRLGRCPGYHLSSFSVCLHQSLVNQLELMWSQMRVCQLVPVPNPYDAGRMLLRQLISTVKSSGGLAIHTTTRAAHFNYVFLC